MRPVYQTHRDETNKQSLVDHVCLSLGYEELERCEKFQPADYFLYKGKKKALLQIKVRTNEFTAFPTYMVSLNKWKQAQAMARHNRCPFFLVVKWRDRVGYIDQKEPDFIAEGGRTDRGDPRDIESMAHFKLASFKPLK